VTNRPPETPLLAFGPAFARLEPSPAASRAMGAHLAAVAPLLPFARSAAAMAPRGPAAAALGPHAPALLHFARAIMAEVQARPPLPDLYRDFTKDTDNG
jgi:hypothetical protein